ncbi:MAG: hypothetical protein A2Z18_07215 [Armatimonadetes bacterium RBG_16_58_9]|nr:MAG: hypothetical protein A2Z18_07215 [Armatimonadetes bacterium RBG_16_58_9]
MRSADSPKKKGLMQPFFRERKGERELERDLRPLSSKLYDQAGIIVPAFFRYFCWVGLRKDASGVARTAASLSRSNVRNSPAIRDSEIATKESALGG